jgi:hypothetical protein
MRTAIPLVTAQHVPKHFATFLVYLLLLSFHNRGQGESHSMATAKKATKKAAPKKAAVKKAAPKKAAAKKTAAKKK